MKKVALVSVGLCLMLAVSQSAPLSESGVLSEVGGSSVEEVMGSIRLNGASYELAENYAPGQFKYTVIGGESSLLAQALDLNRQIDEELSRAEPIYGLYSPILMEISRKADGSLILISFSRAPGY